MIIHRSWAGLLAVAASAVALVLLQIDLIEVLDSMTPQGRKIFLLITVPPLLMTFAPLAIAYRKIVRENAVSWMAKLASHYALFRCMVVLFFNDEFFFGWGAGQTSLKRWISRALLAVVVVALSRLRNVMYARTVEYLCVQEVAAR